jgi:hypothetical protein
MRTPGRLRLGAAIEPYREGQEHPLGASRLLMSTFAFAYCLVVLLAATS